MRCTECQGNIVYAALQRQDNLIHDAEWYGKTPFVFPPIPEEVASTTNRQETDKESLDETNSSFETATGLIKIIMQTVQYRDGIGTAIGFYVLSSTVTLTYASV